MNEQHVQRREMLLKICITILLCFLPVQYFTRSNFTERMPALELPQPLSIPSSTASSNAFERHHSRLAGQKIDRSLVFWVGLSLSHVFFAESPPPFVCRFSVPAVFSTANQPTLPNLTFTEQDSFPQACLAMRSSKRHHCHGSFHRRQTSFSGRGSGVLPPLLTFVGVCCCSLPDFCFQPLCLGSHLLLLRVGNYLETTNYLCPLF